MRLLFVISLCFTSLASGQLQYSGKNVGDIRTSLGKSYKNYASLSLVDATREEVFQVIFNCSGSGIQRTSLIIAKTTGESWRLKTYKSFYGWVRRTEVVMKGGRSHLRIHTKAVGDEGVVDIDLDYSDELLVLVKRREGADVTEIE